MNQAARFSKLSVAGALKLSAAVVAIGLGASSCTTTPYAAKVGSDYVTVSQLNSELNAIAGNKLFVSKITAQEPVYGASTSTFATKFADQVLNRRIALVLIEGAVKKLGLSTSGTAASVARVTAEQSYGGAAAFGAFPRSYQNQLIFDTAAVTALEAYLTKTDMSLPALKAYYTKNVGQFTEICAAHILVSSQAQATSIYNQIKAGANFAQLAKSQSADTNSAGNGGYIGCGTFAQYSNAFGAQFAAAVLAGTPNVVLPPVPETSGYGIGKVVSKTALSFAQALPSVIGAEFGSAGSNDLNAFVSGLAKSAKVDINPVYGSYSISKSTASVVPPKAPSA